MSDTDTRAIKLLAEERSRLQLAVRAVRAEILHMLIEKYIAAARQGQPDKPRKAIIADAAAHYDVSIRAVLRLMDRRVEQDRWIILSFERRVQ